MCFLVFRWVWGVGLTWWLIGDWYSGYLVYVTAYWRIFQWWTIHIFVCLLRSTLTMMLKCQPAPIPQPLLILQPLKSLANHTIVYNFLPINSFLNLTNIMITKTSLLIARSLTITLRLFNQHLIFLITYLLHFILLLLVLHNKITNLIWFYNGTQTFIWILVWCFLFFCWALLYAGGWLQGELLLGGFVLYWGKLGWFVDCLLYAA